MFWGLIMEPGRRYSQTVKQSFHISMAALETTTADNQPTQVMCCFEGRNYLLCTLHKDKSIQVLLDLNFEQGDEIAFATNGSSHVHLTGYLNDDVLEDADEEEDDEENVEEEEANTTSSKKRKASVNGEPRKKLKTEMLLDAIDNEEDSDDSDVDFGGLEDSDEDEEEAEGSDEAEEEVDEEEDVEEEEEEKTEPIKQNGIKQKNKKEKSGKEEKLEKKNMVEKKKQSKENDKSEKSPKKGPLLKKTVEGGVVIEDLVTGNGPIAKPGKSVQVYYEGRLKTNNKMFDSATKGQGFKFRLGKQEVIKGWDVGIQGMKVGGKRKIICPANMAYGSKGSPPVIPPNSTLIFEVELKKVN